AVLFWPGGSLPRYYLPMVLPLCVFGGLGYDLFAEKWPPVIAPMMGITAALLLSAAVYALASPFLPLHYRQAWFDAEKMAAAMQTAPGPLYRTGDTGLNVLPYAPGRILIATPDELASVEGPAWMLLPNDEASVLAARRSDKLHVVMPLGDVWQWRCCGSTRDRAAPYVPAMGSTRRNSISNELTASGCSCWTQCPAPSSRLQPTILVQTLSCMRSKALGC